LKTKVLFAPFRCGEASRASAIIYKVPRKVRELISDLEAAGFVNRGGKGKHRNFVHPQVSRPVTISGNTGDDAKHYQARAVKAAIEESKR
jgi:predicted RNA binding protein YcfA (HicA-like mRNA interferase family)